MLWEIILAAGALGFGAAGIKVRLLEHRRMAGLWEAAATRLGGKRKAKHWLHEPARQELVDGRADGVEVSVHVDSGWGALEDRSASGRLARAMAAMHDAKAIGLAVLPVSTGRKLLLKLGGHDVTMGNPELDGLFIVSCASPALARAWLDDDARRAVLREPRGEVRCHLTRLSLVVRSALHDTGDIVSLARRAATIATGGRRLLDRWRQAAAVLEGKLLQAGPEWPLEGGPTIELHVPGRRATLARAGEIVTISISMARRTATPLTTARLPEAVQALVAAARPSAATRQDHEVTVELDDLEPDHQRWRAAIDLALALVDDDEAAPRLAAYR
jgi:hypothetical protein